MALSNDHTRYLRGLAHTLNPIVMVGNKGVSANLVDELAQALDRHELVKIRVVTEMREDRDTLIDELLKTSGAELVQRIGHTATLFKRHPKKPKIALPGTTSSTYHSRSSYGDAPPKRSSFERKREPMAEKRTHPRAENSVSDFGSGRKKSTPYPVRESGDFEDRTQVIESPYKRRDAKDDRDRPRSPAGKPFVRRDGDFSTRPSGAERKSYARREGSTYAKTSSSERTPYARREGAESPYGGVRRERSHSASKPMERRPFPRDETGTTHKPALAARSERGAYSGPRSKSAVEKRSPNPYQKSARPGAGGARREGSFGAKKASGSGFGKPGNFRAKRPDGSRPSGPRPPHVR